MKKHGFKGAPQGSGERAQFEESLSHGPIFRGSGSVIATLLTHHLAVLFHYYGSFHIKGFRSNIDCKITMRLSQDTLERLQSAMMDRYHQLPRVLGPVRAFVRDSRLLIIRSHFGSGYGISTYDRISDEYNWDKA